MHAIIEPVPACRLGERKSGGSDSPSGPFANHGSPSAARVLPASILIVDDVEDTRELYQRYFEFQGARVTTASDGTQALRTAVAESPDIIVLDLAMPGMTGWDVIRSLKANPITKAIPVIVLSGQGARESAIAAGADSYREKPCLPDELLAEIQRVLRHSSAGH